MFLSRRPRHDDERGWVLVWFAIMLVVLLAMAAFAVDTGLWTYDQTKEQRAADAAALAGSVYLPGNFNQAKTVALDVARVNGYAPDTDTQVDVTQVTGQPNQLQVSITDTAQNLFGSYFGYTTTQIKKIGVATYDPPIAMGSPVNQVGNDPESTGTYGSDRYPNLWLSVAGSTNAKQNGDAYLSNSCASPADNCIGSNSDYTPSGYFYTVHVINGGPLQVQGFDPGYVDVGQTCGTNTDNSNLIGASNLGSNFNPVFSVTDAGTRYKPVSNSGNSADPGYRYCTGDQSYPSSVQTMTTTYKIFGPATVPGEPSSAPTTPLCTKTFPGFTGDLVAGLRKTTPNSGAPDALVKYFRQWYTLTSGCPTISAASGSDYFVQVTTGTGDAQNRFALRAGIGASPNYANTDTNVYASSRMAIYANVGDSTLTKFHLARLLPGAPGRTLVLDFFDIGDSQGATGTLQIVPPSDARTGGTMSNGTPVGGSTLGAFSNCKYTAPPGNSTGPPWSSTLTGMTNCTITNVTQNNYQGQWVEVTVPIPDTYACNVNSAQGCWVLIAYQFNADVNDTTSWTAHIDGDPVRLVG